MRKIGYKLVVFINRKSHTGFSFVPKLVTLNGLEWPLFCVISLNSAELKLDPHCLRQQFSTDNLVFGNVRNYSQRLVRKSAIKRDTPLNNGNFTDTAIYLGNDARHKVC